MPRTYCPEPAADVPSEVCGHEMPCPEHGPTKLVNEPSAAQLVPEPNLRGAVYPGWDTELPGTPRDPEVRALARIVAALQLLDPAARGRILRYLSQRYEPVRTGGMVINNPLTPR